jgi:hypothetical protein
MKKCKACKSEIDSQATKCPRCGADQRSWFRRHPILTVILALILIGIIGGAVGGNKNNSSPQPTQTANNTQAQNNPQVTPQATQQPTIVDATTLIGEFDKNKLAANDKYTGKLVQTTGYISNISGGDLGGDYYIVINPSAGQDYFGTDIQAFFKDKTVLTTLSNGDKVTVQGTMGDMTLGSVVINDCSVVK